MNPITASVRLKGEGRGANVISKIDFPYDEEGLSWFKIYIDTDITHNIE